MLPVRAQVPVTGLYSSVVRLPFVVPPTTSTKPFGSRVAVWPKRARFIRPVAAQVPVEGSYSSALDKTTPLESTPPAGLYSSALDKLLLVELAPPITNT